MNKAENEIAEAILKIADAIDGHSKSIDGLSQNIRWSFMDDYDQNVPNKIEGLYEAFNRFNDLIEEAGRLLDITHIGNALKER
jgi:hypothetical protein